MASKEKKPAVPAQLPQALDLFFQSVESRTSDPTHLRLLKAARKADAVSSLERELGKIMDELLHET